jgi:uncharacterized protein YbjQ (UPF0145 family)
MDVLFQLGVFITLLFLGYVFGRRAEARHYKTIRMRERAFRKIVVLNERFPPPHLCQHQSTMVCGNVVVSVDYFKVVVAGLRSLVGGRMTAYESLLDRGRREAILRMQNEAKNLGAEAVINLKFETSQISGQAGQGLGSIEVLAYGTALIPVIPE